APLVPSGVINTSLARPRRAVLLQRLPLLIGQPELAEVLHLTCRGQYVEVRSEQEPPDTDPSDLPRNLLHRHASLTGHGNIGQIKKDMPHRRIVSNNMVAK